MVTLQVLVLSFPVRIRVVQPSIEEALSITAQSFFVFAVLLLEPDVRRDALDLFLREIREQA